MPRELAWIASALVLCGCFVDAVGGTGEGGGGSATTTSGATTTGAGQGGEAASGGAGGAGGVGGAGGSTTSGMGGADCGDGVRETGEECDDGNQDEGDGCTTMCEAEMLGACPAPSSSTAVLGALGDVVTVSGDTTDATDTLRLGDGESCNSDGPDEWLAVRVLVPGTVTVELTAKDGFGGNQENAVLHIRRGCTDRLYEDELACSDTNGNPQGTLEQRFFARAGEVFYFVVDGDGGNEDGTYDLTVGLDSECGDGVVEGMEQCDEQSQLCTGCMATGPGCGAGLEGGSFSLPTKHCYGTTLGNAPNYFDAREACFFAGGDLVTIDSGEVLPTTTGEVWTGLADLKDDGTDDFRWLTTNQAATPNTVNDSANVLRGVVLNGTSLDDKYTGNDYRAFCELTFANP
ncbi:MAG: hypothetical protein JNL21_36570 [Myxococcales bacterium]|nr:hypothetical protein [Myxococcales bacterium]